MTLILTFLQPSDLRYISINSLASSIHLFMPKLSTLRLCMTRLREVIFWPLLFACSPLYLQRKIARHIQSQSHFYKAEIQAMESHVLKYLPDTDLVKAAENLRLVHLIDKSDVFSSTLRFKSCLQHRVLVGRLPALDSGALILLAHRGNGWWSLPVLRRQGRPVHFVSGPMTRPITFTDYLLWPYQLLRWHAVNTLGGAPLIPMKGASQRIQQILADKGRVIALIDIPPALAKRCSPVKFLGATAYMPIQSIRLAFEAGVPIYFCNADFDESSFKQTIDFEPADMSGSPENVAARYANWLEAHIRQRPGSWHVWGHVDAFFKTPAQAVISSDASIGTSPTLGRLP